MSITLPEFWQLAVAEMTRANADRRHPFRNVVIATCSNNIPGMRTVVMRKFDSGQGVLIYTDCRSQKFQDLQRHPEQAASLLFWHPKKNLQVRMQGRVMLSVEDETAKVHWLKVPPVSKRSYTTAQAPGTIIENPEAVEHDAALEDGRYFTVLHFQPHSAELLQLNRDLHLRAIFHLENETWQGHWLVP